MNVKCKWKRTEDENEGADERVQISNKLGREALQEESKDLKGLRE